MYEQVGDSEKIARWQRIFHSVKRRLLHGAPHSLMPEGDTREEDTIMSHVRTFINRFKNPAFVGFSIDPGSSNASPAPNPPATAVAANDKHTALQPASTVQPVNGSQEIRKDSTSDSKPSTQPSTAPTQAITDTADSVQDSGVAKDDSAQAVVTEGTAQKSSESQDVDKKTENLTSTAATSA
jgi:hypothetical protein